MVPSTTTRASQPNYRGMTLDQAIEHEIWTNQLAADMAAQPKRESCKEAAEFFLTEDLIFTPVKANSETRRRWEIELPLESGRKMKRGMTLMLIEGSSTMLLPTPEFTYVTFAVRTTRLRRFMNPKYMNWFGRTFLGTWWIQLTKYDASISCLSSRADLAKFTKAI